MQSHITSAKNAIGNKFQVLADEKKEGENAEGEERNSLQEDEIPKESPPLVLDEQPVQSSPDRTQTEARPESSANNEGTCIRSKTRATSEEVSKNSNEEPKRQSKKGRRSNKTLREQKATRERAAGKQSDLDFLVRNHQANKYLLTPEEEKKEKERVLH